MSARTAKLARPAESLTEWEKERYIHDFICTGVRYDKLKKPYSHEIIGPLGQGWGLRGIAKTVKILCDALGIWCMIAISEANPEKNIKYRHAWNIVRIGGRYYHLDATLTTAWVMGRPSATTTLTWMIGSCSAITSQPFIRRRRAVTETISITGKEAVLHKDGRCGQTCRAGVKRESRLCSTGEAAI